jgi:hypothetical protein
MFINSGTITIRTTPAIATEMRQFVTQLCRDDVDGQEHRWATGYRIHSPRPIIENLAGDRFRLLVEGPIHRERGFRYPFGGLIANGAGWTSLDPIDTSLLIARLRPAIDTTIDGWFDEIGQPAVWTPEPRRIDRKVDDAIAIERMHQRARIVRQFSSCRGL